MNDINVNPEVLINELLDQIKKLTLDNAILKCYINDLQNKKAQESIPKKEIK